MRSQPLIAVAVVSLLLFAPAWVEAKDLTLRQRVTTAGEHPETHEATQYWTADKVVLDAPDERIIVDLGAQTVTIANKHQQTYFTQTSAEMQKYAEALKAAMQERMQSLPPDVRETMGKMGMGPTGAEAEVSVKPTGKSEKIAGYEAKEYAVEGGPMTASVWATDALEPPGGAQARAAFDKIATGGFGTKFTQAIAAIKGVPLRSIIRSAMGPGKSGSSTTEVIEVSEKAPPADVLKVPAGFTKVAASESGPGQPGKGVPMQ